MPSAANYPPFLGDHLAPRDRHDGPPCHFEPLPRRVVRPVMEDFLPNRLLAMRIPKRQVSIKTNPDRSLLWIKAIELSVVRGGELDKTVKRDPPRRDPFREQDRQPSFHSGNAVRHPAKRGAPVRAELPLDTLVAKRTMV